MKLPRNFLYSAYFLLAVGITSLQASNAPFINFLKSQGIENPTPEEIAKVRSAKSNAAKTQAATTIKETRAGAAAAAGAGAGAHGGAPGVIPPAPPAPPVHGAAHAIAPLADPYKFRGEIITAPAAPVGNESVWHIKITATKDAAGATVAPAATEIMVLRGEAARAAGLDLAHLNVATKLEFERKSARNRIMAPHVNEHGAGLGGNIGHYQALDRMQIIH